MLRRWIVSAHDFYWNFSACMKPSNLKYRPPPPSADQTGHMPEPGVARRAPS